MAELDALQVEPIWLCPACGGRGRSRVLGRKRAPIAVVRCLACHHVYATGRVAHEVLDDGYSARAESRAPDDVAAGADPFMRTRKRRALALYDELSNGAVARVPDGGRALDVGCNVGALLDELVGLGWITEGVERAPSARALAGQRHVVYDVDIESEAVLPHRYALVTMTHVLEHLDKPLAGLKFIARHLAPGGTAIIEVPNWDDPARLFWRTRYRPLELGDHVSFFDRGSLGALAEKAGLRVHRWWSAPQGATVVMPSLLTATDVLSGLVRRGRTTGGLATRVESPPMPSTTRQRVLGLLDLLDPWIASWAGEDPHWGANLVAVLRRPRIAS